MKQLIFSKDDLELVKLCVQNELARLETTPFPQDTEILKEVDKRIDDCRKLLWRLENV